MKIETAKSWTDRTRWLTRNLPLKADESSFVLNELSQIGELLQELKPNADDPICYIGPCQDALCDLSESDPIRREAGVRTLLEMAAELDSTIAQDTKAESAMPKWHKQSHTQSNKDHTTEKIFKWIDLVDQVFDFVDNVGDLLTRQERDHDRRLLRQIGRLLDELQNESGNAVVGDWIIARGLCGNAPGRIVSAAHVFLRELAHDLDAEIDGLHERAYRFGPWNYGAGEPSDLMPDELYI